MNHTRAIVGLSAGTIIGMLPQAASADITTPIVSPSGACSGSMTLVVPSAPTTASQISARTSANCTVVQSPFQSKPQVKLTVKRYDPLTPYSFSTQADMTSTGTYSWQITDLTAPPSLWEAKKYETTATIDIFPYGSNTIGTASIIKDYSPPPVCTSWPCCC